MAINKTEFINRWAKKSNTTKVHASKNIDAFFETFIECLQEEGTVRLYPLGKFELKTTNERIGRNPKNGRECMIPKQKKVRFRPSKKLTSRIEE